MRDPKAKIMSVEQAASWRRALAATGKKLVMTNGCFDLLHRGHVEYLNLARQEGDALLVAINADASLREVKGPGRPIVAEADRAYQLASLESVDAVVVFAQRKPLELFKAAPPDIYVKGGDYTVETIDQEERRLLEGLGCRFHFPPEVPGVSTTDLIFRIVGS